MDRIREGLRSMSEFAPALAIVLAHEGGFYHDPATGEYAMRGITLATLRRLGILKTVGVATDEDIAFVKSLTEDEAAEIYKVEYWDNIGALSSQDVANKVFDLQVNTGHGVIFLQRALGVPEDGVLGPITASRANAWQATTLLGAIRAAGRSYYEAVAAAKPDLAKDLPGWLERLDC